MALRYAATAVFMVIVLASGLLHGRQTHRWTEKPKLDQYVQRLANIPEKFDNWTSEIDPTSEEQRLVGIRTKVDPASGKMIYVMEDNLAAHGIEGYIFRVYRNKNSTERYQVFVVCGRGGPIASHTPDVCYKGSGFQQVGEQKRVDVAVPDSPKVFSLLQLKFHPPANRPTEAYLEKNIHWVWMPPAKGLMAPDTPRFEFASLPVLYKVYIIHDRNAAAAALANNQTGTPAPLAGGAAVSAQHDAQKFLQAFLPRLEVALKDPTN